MSEARDAPASTLANACGMSVQVVDAEVAAGKAGAGPGLWILVKVVFVVVDVRSAQV